MQGNLEYMTGYWIDGKGNLEDGRGDGIDVQKDLEYEERIRPRFQVELEGGDHGDPRSRPL